MKRGEITRLWIEILLNNLLMGSLALAATVIFGLLSLNGESWPAIIASFVAVVFFASLLKEISWGVFATRAYLYTAPVPCQVRFQVDREVPEGFVGLPDGPVPCYAFLNGSGTEQKVKVHPLVFKTSILKKNNRSASIYGFKQRRPYAIETNEGLAWVLEWLS